MTTNINIYDKRSLTNAVKKIKVVEPFVLNKYFKRQKPHSSNKIDVEIIESQAKLAQFVNDGEGAMLIGKRTKSVKTVTIPRTFEKKVWTTQELADYKALIGDVYAPAPDRARAANEFVLDEISDLKDRVMNRREQMACSILNSGVITIDQDNIDFTLDFDFVTGTLEAGGHIITLAADDQWDDGTTKDILDDIRSFKRAIMQRSHKNADTCLLGENAAKAFVQDSDVMAALDNLNYKVGQIDLNQQNEQFGIYIGRFMGIDFWEYNQQYTDSDGNATDIIDKHKAIFFPSTGRYDLHIGPIYRINKSNEFEIIQSEFLLEPKVDDDGTYLEWKLEQKSLPAIVEADLVISANVVPSV